MSESSPFRLREGYENAEIAPDLRAEFSRRGKAGVEKAKANGTHHRFTAEEAARGGAIGGRTRANTPGAMSEMGKKGAKAAAEARRRRKEERESTARLDTALRNAATWGERMGILAADAMTQPEGAYMEIMQGGDQLSTTE